VWLGADTRAPFGTVVDAIVLAQNAGATILIGVAPPPPSPPSSASETAPQLPPDGFSRCPFPAAADREGVNEGSATIRVRVDVNGKVTDVTVLQDDGHGFGAAAQACAQKSTFVPARDANGKPIAGGRTVRIRFTR
jgi:protein TonB